MKKMLSLVLIFALLLGCCPEFFVVTEAAIEGLYEYQVEEGNAVIVGADPSISGDIVIPSTLGGYPVTEINYGVFSGYHRLTSVAVPASVTEIGKHAFALCPVLTGIWVSEENAHYSSDHRSMLVDKTKDILLLAPGGLTGSYEIPATVTTEVIK